MNVEMAQEIIVAQFPDLEVEHVAYLGQGFDSVAFLINQKLVFRFPQEDDVADCLQIEMALLPQLAPSLTLSIPQFTFNGRRPDNGWPFVGYPMIVGPSLKQVNWAKLPQIVQREVAQAIAQFLLEMQRFPLAAAQACGVKTQDFQQSYADLWQEMGEQLRPYLTVSEWELLGRLFDNYLGDGENFTHEPCLLHADIWSDHIICDANSFSVKGIIDFGDVVIGDPAYELAFLWGEYGSELVEQILEFMEMHPTERLWAKLKLFWIANMAEDALYGLELEDEGLFERSFGDMRGALG